MACVTLLRIGCLWTCFPSCRNGLLHFIVDDQITLVAPHRTEGDNHGGDDHTAFLITFEGGGLGIHPEAIVDDMLAVLPAPARHHILPDCCGEDFHFAI